MNGYNHSENTDYDLDHNCNKIKNFTLIFFRYFSSLVFLWTIGFAAVLLYAHLPAHEDAMRHTINIRPRLNTEIQAIGQFFTRESQPPATDAHDPVSCKCRLGGLKFRTYYKSQLSVTLPWLNMTSYEMLERTHPNLPINMYHDLAAKRCHLLPSFSR